METIEWILSNGYATSLLNVFDFFQDKRTCPVVHINTSSSGLRQMGKALLGTQANGEGPPGMFSAQWLRCWTAIGEHPGDFPGTRFGGTIKSCYNAVGISELLMKECLPRR